jgi:hypothetical protein
MSAFPDKVVIDGIVDIGGEKVFALQFLQARHPDWVRRPFYAKFDPTATERAAGWAEAAMEWRPH